MRKITKASHKPDSIKGRGGKLARSEIVSVRFEPKLRYLAELMARKRRRTLSSFVEWLVEDSMAKSSLYFSPDQKDGDLLSIQDEASKLWNVDEAERFVSLAVLHPELLNQDEQEIWKMLNDSWLVSPAKKTDSTGRITWDWRTLRVKVFPIVHVYWVSLQESFAAGQKQEWILATQKAVFDMKDYLGPVTDEYIWGNLPKP